MSFGVAPGGIVSYYGNDARDFAFSMRIEHKSQIGHNGVVVLSKQRINDVCLFPSGRCLKLYKFQY